MACREARVFTFSHGERSGVFSSHVHHLQLAPFDEHVKCVRWQVRGSVFDAMVRQNPMWQLRPELETQLARQPAKLEIFSPICY